MNNPLNAVTKQNSSANRKLLTNSLTLIALGLSILFLNSWDNVFVRTSVGLFWGGFILILNGPAAIKTLRNLARRNETNRRNYGFSLEP